MLQSPSPLLAETESRLQDMLQGLLGRRSAQGWELVRVKVRGRRGQPTSPTLNLVCCLEPGQFIQEGPCWVTSPGNTGWGYAMTTVLTPQAWLGEPAGLLSPSTNNGNMKTRTPGFCGPQSPSKPLAQEATPGARRVQPGSCRPLPSLACWWSFCPPPLPLCPAMPRTPL